MKQNRYIFCFLLLSSIVTLWCLYPLRDNPHYHDFAEQRIICGVPHVGDVLSNLAFIVVGLILLWRGNKTELKLYEFQDFMYYFFAFSCILLGLGSGYYHWNPNNATLAWDRGTMVVGFTVIFMDSLWRYRILSDEQSATRFAICFFAFVGSVMLWNKTGILEPYILVQFFTMFVLPFIALSRYKVIQGKALLGLFVFYAIAKFFEHYDIQTWLVLHGVISGHTIKHLMYAVALLYYGWHMRCGNRERLPISNQQKV